MKMLIAKRVSAGLSQAELAERLGVGRSAVTMWETTKSRPNVDMLPKIARTLGCSIDELFSVEEKAAGYMESTEINLKLGPGQYSGDGESRVRVHQAAAKIAATCEELRLSPAELDRATAEAKDRCVLNVRPEAAGYRQVLRSRSA